VRFDSDCEFQACGKTSEVYTMWPRCRDCGIDFVCPDHMTPGTLDDETMSCVCKTCGEA
jgi:hypothetical protein